MWDVSVVTASWPCYCRGLGAQANTDEAFRQRGPQAQKPAARPGPPGAGAADKGPSDVGSWPGLLQLPPLSRCGGAGAPRRPRPAPGPPLHGLLYAHPLSPPLFGWILLNCWMQLRGRKKVWKNRGLGLGAGRRGSCRARESPRESGVGVPNLAGDPAHPIRCPALEEQPQAPPLPTPHSHTAWREAGHSSSAAPASTVFPPPAAAHLEESRSSSDPSQSARVSSSWKPPWISPSPDRVACALLMCPQSPLAALVSPPRLGLT